MFGSKTRRYELNHGHGNRLRRRFTRGPLVAVVLVLVLAAVAAIYFSPHAAAPTRPVAGTPTAKVPPAEGLTSRLLFVGDVFWGRAIQTAAQRSPLKYGYPLHGLAGSKQGYDAWIANFECPITDRDIPYAQQVAHLSFNCRPEYLPALAKQFSAVTLANNHMDNNGGQWGLAQTRKNLQKAGIQYFGTYDMSQTADICEVVSLPAATSTTHRKVQLPIALCGYMYVVDATPTDAQLQVMQAYAKVMPVIAMPHMGVEYRPTAEPAKVAAYHRMIDNGADLVVGAHPHVIQNSEAYHGKLIAYSEGNFLFDQQSLGRATTLGLGVGVTLTVKDGEAAKTYEAIASSCQVYKDDCLARLSASIHHRPVINVSYKYTCFDESGGVPVPGSNAACTAANKAATWPVNGQLDSSW